MIVELLLHIADAVAGRSVAVGVDPGLAVVLTLSSLQQRLQRMHGAAGIGTVGRQPVKQRVDLFAEELAGAQHIARDAAGVEGVEVELGASGIAS